MAVAVRQRVDSSTPNGTTTSAALPAYVAGDFWLWVLYTRGTTMPNVTAPAGWTRVSTRTAAASGSAPGFAVYARVADGTEGPTASVTLGNSGVVRHVVYAFSGADTAVQFTNAGTNTVLAGAGRDVSSTLNQNAQDPGAFTNAVAGSFIVQGAFFCTSNGGPDVTFSRSDVATSWRQVAGVSTNAISGHIALSTSELAAGSTGSFGATSDVSTRWTAFAITIAPLLKPESGGAGSAQTDATGGGTVITRGGGAATAGSSAAGGGRATVLGGGRAEAITSALGAGLAQVLGGGKADAASGAQGGAGPVLTGGGGQAHASTDASGGARSTVLAGGLGEVSTDAAGGALVRVNAGGAASTTAGSGGGGFVAVNGGGRAPATTGALGGGIAVDPRPVRDQSIRAVLDLDTLVVYLEPDDTPTATLEAP